RKRDALDIDRARQDVGHAAAHPGGANVAVAAPGLVVGEGAVRDGGAGELEGEAAAHSTADERDRGGGLIVVPALGQVVLEGAAAEGEAEAGPEDRAATAGAGGEAGEEGGGAEVEVGVPPAGQVVRERATADAEAAEVGQADPAPPAQARRA